MNMEKRTNTMTMEEMRKSPLTINKHIENMRLSSDSPTSFLSLPYDVILNCLARISRIHHPSLSLVSKNFRSLLASPELDATRSCMEKLESFLYVCFKLNKNNPNPSWFILSPIPKQKLIPIPSFPYKHSKCPSVISVGSEIYIIGGSVNEKRSKKVFRLDCKSHRWSTLPKMRVPREEPAADVINGKIHVIGGCMSQNNENWGEVYEPNTKNWEPLSPTTIDLTAQKSVFPGALVMGGKIHDMDGLLDCEKTYMCFVEIDNQLYQILVYSGGVLCWRDPKDISSEWTKVMGLKGLPKKPDFETEGISSKGRKVIVWWKNLCQGCHRTGECKKEIWCADVSFERRGKQELWGHVEWLENVFTYDGCDSQSDILLHSAMVTH